MLKPANYYKSHKLSLPSVSTVSIRSHSRKASVNSVKSPSQLHISKNFTSSFCSPRVSLSTTAATSQSQSQILSKCNQILQQISDFSSKDQLQHAMKQSSCLKEKLQLLDMIAKRKEEIKEVEERMKIDNNVRFLLKVREKFKKKRLSGSGPNNLLKFRNSIKECVMNETVQQEQKPPESSQKKDVKRELSVLTKNLSNTEPKTNKSYLTDARLQMYSLYSEDFLKKKSAGDGSPLQSPAMLEMQKKIKRRKARDSICLMLKKSPTRTEKGLVFEDNTESMQPSKKSINEVNSSFSSSQQTDSIVMDNDLQENQINQHLEKLKKMLKQQERQRQGILVTDSSFLMAKSRVENDIYKFLMKEKSRNEKFDSESHFLSFRSANTSSNQLQNLESNVSQKITKTMKQVKEIRVQAPGKIERSKQFLEFIKKTSKPQLEKKLGRTIRVPVGNKYGVLMFPSQTKN